MARRPPLRLAAVGLTAAAALSGLVASAGAAPAQHRSAQQQAVHRSPRIGDTCLAGSWQERSQWFQVRLHHENVVMHGLAGTTDRFSRDGRAVTHWGPARHATGELADGTAVTEHVSGKAVGRVSADGERVRFGRARLHDVVMVFDIAGRRPVTRTPSHQPGLEVDYSCSSTHWSDRYVRSVRTGS